MAQYKLLQTSFVDNHLRWKGDVVTVKDDLVPGPHMVPVDGTAKKIGRQIGLVNDVVPDFVDQQTGQIDVTRYGASPQSIAAGIAREAEGVEGMLGPEHLRNIP